MVLTISVGGPLSAAALVLCGLVTLPLRGLRPRFDRGVALRPARQVPAAGEAGPEASLAALWRRNFWL